MGCDIHTFAEIRRDYDGKSTWHAVKEPVFEDAYYRADAEIGIRNTPYSSTPYKGRNYDLFALLAGVRNSSLDPITPISEPRGVPEDASKRWKKYVERWGSDLHSTSYFTVAELKAATEAFDQTIHDDALISIGQYKAIRESGFTITPDTWWGGDNARKVTTDEADEMLDRGDDVSSERISVSYRWETPMRERVGFFVEKTIPALERLAPFVGPHPGWNQPDTRERDLTAVRLVFGFDN